MTIEELLNSMQGKYKIRDKTLNGKSLPNNVDTWNRIANRDSFSEFLFSDESEKDKFLREWINENPYNNI
jgi:hypothetical protein